MAKASAPPTPEKSSILPMSEIAIGHHGKALFGPMREWRTNKRLPPVLLITGAAGVGKHIVAHYLAQWIFCENSGFQDSPESDGGLFAGMETSASAGSDTAAEPRPCGECVACRRALNGTWVDFTEVTPEEDSKGGESTTLKIDQFRKLKERLGFGGHESAYRVVLVPDADRMTAQAANSILKLLEEPPPGWIFFLTASDPSLLLPTIVSRCQSLKLRPFSPENLQGLLTEAGVPPERRALGALLAEGSWGKALQLTGDEVWESRKNLAGFLKHPASSINPLLDWAAQDTRHLELLLDQLEQIAADLIHWSLATAETTYTWRNEDLGKPLQEHARQRAAAAGSTARAREFWIRQAERMAQARRELHLPLNRKLLIQDLLLPWLAPA